MLHKRSRLPARSAFTLIELLVVIAIIAVLVSLTSAAVMKALSVATRVQTTNDITKLQDGLEAAKKRYSDAPVLPSQLLLYNDLSRYKTDTSALSKRSADTLRLMFKRRLLEYGTFVYWDGTTNNAGVNTLEGQQCLVFYLGGATVTSPVRGCLGFSTDPLNPMKPGGERMGPYYDFKSTRLQGTTFFSYLDPYHSAGDQLAQPYAYFSSTTKANTYNFYYSVPTFVTSDCPSLGLWPYVDANGQYLNPNTYQIISAGADGVFGVGGGPPGSPATFSGSVYDPVNGAKDAPTRDNQANFSKSILAGPQN